ncbi:hypothetical protein Tsubulata_009004 [Turnera subulata]|uniref:Alkaline/neutral invertase n=1 Tax=Turnera subulata TaxID=218843 RepID=A0A9Q0J8E1_9ROSI|nr:hypothetical protein Tsubulata_009004 [Turnera subulata]
MFSSPKRHRLICVAVFAIHLGEGVYGRFKLGKDYGDHHIPATVTGLFIEATLAEKLQREQRGGGEAGEERVLFAAAAIYFVGFSSRSRDGERDRHGSSGDIRRVAVAHRPTVPSAPFPFLIHFLRPPPPHRNPHLRRNGSRLSSRCCPGEYYWIDLKKTNEIYRYATEEYSYDAVNKFNIYPDQIPPWLVDFLPSKGGYLIGNLQPAHMDFRFFSLGNLWSISLVIPQWRILANVALAAKLDIKDGKIEAVNPVNLPLNPKHNLVDFAVLALAAASFITPSPLDLAINNDSTEAYT